MFSLLTRLSTEEGDRMRPNNGKLSESVCVRSNLTSNNNVIFQQSALYHTFN